VRAAPVSYRDFSRNSCNFQAATLKQEKILMRLRARRRAEILRETKLRLMENLI